MPETQQGEEPGAVGGPDLLPASQPLNIGPHACGVEGLYLQDPADPAENGAYGPHLPCPSPGATADTRTLQPAARLHPVDQWSPNFLYTEDQFVEDSFSTDQGMLAVGSSCVTCEASLHLPTAVWLSFSQTRDQC